MAKNKYKVSADMLKPLELSPFELGMVNALERKKAWFPPERWVESESKVMWYLSKEHGIDFAESVYDLINSVVKKHRAELAKERGRKSFER